MATHGFLPTEGNDWNLCWTSVSLGNKPQIYDAMLDHQKINHFQGSTELTRKDRLAENIYRMKQKFGNQDFDFVPETFQLPDEF